MSVIIDIVVGKDSMDIQESELEVVSNEMIDNNISVDNVMKQLIRQLAILGLTQNEARILLYLVIRGEQPASQISYDLKIQRTEAYNYISSLTAKGVVFSTIDRPQKYFTKEFKDIVEMLIASKMLEMQKVKVHMDGSMLMIDKLISRFKENHDPKQKFETYQGLGNINVTISRLKNLIDTAIEIRIFATDFGFFTLYHNGLYDYISDKLNSIQKPEVTIITSYPDAKEQKFETYIHEKVAIHVSDILPYKATFIVTKNSIDKEEVVILVDEENRSGKALYTSAPGMIGMVKQIFSDIQTKT